MVQLKKPMSSSSSLNNNKKKKKIVVLPSGINLIVGFFVVSIPLWIVGQGGAVIAYDTVAALGLQVAAREELDPVIVEECRGIGLADVVVQVPLFLLAITGLQQLQFYGAVASWLALGVNLYWPIVAWSKQSFFVNAGTIQVVPFPASLHTLLAFIVLFSAWASWYLYQNRKLFLD